MKKLLLGAMLAAACITTDVNADFLGIRTKGEKAEVDSTLKKYAGNNYEEVSKNIINHTNDLKTAISTIKEDKNNKTILKTKIQIVDGKETKTKTANKILGDILKESKKISEFFKYMTKKESRTKIAEKGENAKQAANVLLASLNALKGSKEKPNLAWEHFKDKLKTSIIATADELKPWAENAIAGIYVTKKGKGKELNIKALLTSLSDSFEEIRKVFETDNVAQPDNGQTPVNANGSPEKGNTGGNQQNADNSSKKGNTGGNQQNASNSPTGGNNQRVKIR